MQQRLVSFFSLLSVIAFVAFVGVVAFPTSIRHSLLTKVATSLKKPFLYYQLGQANFKDSGVSRNLVQAQHWYQKAADLGHAKSMYKLGNLLSHRHGIQKKAETKPEFWQDIPLDLDSAITWYTKAADCGYPNACLRLGYFNREGVGMPVNYQKAFAWYRKAAKAGSKKAQSWLGFFYSHGFNRESEWLGTPDCWEGIPKDYPKAFSWYLKSAQNGIDTAQYMVGFMSAHGVVSSSDFSYGLYPGAFEVPGIPLDYKQAEYWLKKAANQGHHVASCLLAFLYLHGGHGLEPDPKAAIYWYNRGIELGSARCMRKLASCYEDGNGVEQDFVLAEHWYKRAIQNGDEFSEKCYKRFCDLQYDEIISESLIRHRPHWL